MSMCNKMHKMSHRCEHEGENQNELLVSVLHSLSLCYGFIPPGFLCKVFNEAILTILKLFIKVD
ncbi:hypothetical protein Syun_007988 [Stephania yunnanensis]|uniref:Uncharacterized protein n=1 Tax=Stephania yunnanensis TaxID=152371 RepID=A0AAP0PZ03_9MAGN